MGYSQLKIENTSKFFKIWKPEIYKNVLKQIIFLKKVFTNLKWRIGALNGYRQAFMKDYIIFQGGQIQESSCVDLQEQLREGHDIMPD